MILGIDPGLASCGFAILSSGDHLESCGCLTTKKTLPLATRLNQIYQEVTKLCQENDIDQMAIESLFFAKNSKTAIQVAQAMGVVKAAADQAGIKVYEYTPPQIKIAITGYGRADKNQVIAMVSQSLGCDGLTNNHAADAAAAAMTHFFTLRKEALT